MVSGFLISPNDQEEMSSGLAMEMRIWSNAGTCTCCLKRLVISFIGSLSPGGLGALCPPKSGHVVLVGCNKPKAHCTDLRDRYRCNALASLAYCTLRSS